MEQLFFFLLFRTVCSAALYDQARILSGRNEKPVQSDLFSLASLRHTTHRQPDMESQPNA